MSPPPIQSRMPWRVVEAQPLADFRLRVWFIDGLEGMVEMSALRHSSAAGVFAQLADPPDSLKSGNTQDTTD